jgi:hypothetical protein
MKSSWFYFFPSSLQVASQMTVTHRPQLSSSPKCSRWNLVSMPRYTITPTACSWPPRSEAPSEWSARTSSVAGPDCRSGQPVIMEAGGPGSAQSPASWSSPNVNSLSLLPITFRNRLAALDVPQLLHGSSAPWARRRRRVVATVVTSPRNRKSRTEHRTYRSFDPSWTLMCLSYNRVYI